MARKRIIDPEFWSDQEIGFWSFEARLLYIGTWNFADDEGRFKSHSSLLKSQIFPYDLKINIELLKKEIATKIQWYMVNKMEYGFIRNFLKHQRIDRPTPSKLPSPPEISRILDEILPSTQEHVLPNTTEVKLSKDKVREDKKLLLSTVYLTDEEHKKLIKRYGEEGTKQRIYDLNNGIMSKGYKYKSHYHTILSWERRHERFK